MNDKVGKGGLWSFQVFITGDSPRSTAALTNLRRLCAERDITPEIEVVDVVQRPRDAEALRILATPTVIRRLPMPVRRVIGDLSDYPQVAMALDLPQPDSQEERR